MKNITLAITSFCAIAMLSTSCVSNKKYNDARAAAAANMSEKQRVQAELNVANDSINKLRNYNNALGDVYRSTNQELSLSKEQIVEQQKRLQQLQERIDAQRRNTEALRKKIADALVGFNANELLDIFLAQTYRVYMLGFLPGFAYMGEVDDRIAAPRLETPRTKVPAGSVGIAGKQTGIYPLESPGGWNIIGRTDLKMFDPTSDQPCLLKPGDEVRFVRC